METQMNEHAYQHAEYMYPESMVVFKCTHTAVGKENREKVK